MERSIPSRVFVPVVLALVGLIALARRPSLAPGSPAPAADLTVRGLLGPSPAFLVFKDTGRVQLIGQWQAVGEAPPAMGLKSVHTFEISCRKSASERGTCVEALAEASSEKDAFDVSMGTAGRLGLRLTELPVIEWTEDRVVARSGELSVSIDLARHQAERLVRYSADPMDVGPPETRRGLARWRFAS